MKHFTLFIIFCMTCPPALTSILGFQEVKVGSTICILNDGNIVPALAPINRNGNSYTFTDNINSEILVERSNITIDGNGYTVQGNGTGIGFRLESNTTLTNTRINNFSIGILLNTSSGNRIAENNITACSEYALYLDSSSKNQMIRNVMENNFRGVQLWNAHNNTVLRNVIRAESVYNDYGIRLDYSTDNAIAENTVEYNDEAIWLSNSANNTIAGNSVQNNYYGIVVANSTENRVFGNNITNNEGIRIRFSSHNLIYENRILGNDNHGVWIFNSSCNSIYLNIICENRFQGIWLSGSSSSNNMTQNYIANNHDSGISISGRNNMIAENTIADNVCGIESSLSSNGRYYHNNLVSNLVQAVQSLGYTNFWDDGYPSGGNYWSDYVGVDQNMDGLADDLIQLDQNNTDNYPLMGAFYGFTTSLLKEIYIVSNTTIENLDYVESNTTIRIAVSNSTPNQQQGFCRIRVPHSLMSEPYNITIDGAAPLYYNHTLFDDGKNRWIYFTFACPTSEIVIVVEFTSFAIPFLLVGTILVQIMRRVWTRKP